MIFNSVAIKADDKLQIIDDLENWIIWNKSKKSEMFEILRYRIPWTQKFLPKYGPNILDVFLLIYLIKISTGDNDVNLSLWQQSNKATAWSWQRYARSRNFDHCYFLISDVNHSDAWIMVRWLPLGGPWRWKKPD